MATVGLYGSSTSGVVAAATGSESTGLYGNGTSFGGSYFEWFIFQQADTQPATPTGGSWSFTTNSGTPPTGWSSFPPSAPTNKVWVSIALVNSKTADALTWSAPGLFSYSSGLPVLSGNGTPAPSVGQSDQLYIQLDTTPQTIWFKESGTWTRLTGSTLYVDLTSNQTISGTKTFSSQIQGSVSGTASNVTGVVGIANGGTGSTTAAGARTALGAASSGANSDITSLSGITGAITTPNYVAFNTSYTTPLGVGQLGWDGNNTLGLGMAGGNVVQKIGEDQFYYIKASSAITKGQVVMFTGAVGASGVVTGAPATGVTDGSYIMGIAAETIALNGFGLVQFEGTLRGIDTSAFTDGAILWYNPAVTGGLTATQPSAPNIKVQMAAVINAGSGGSGSVLIRVTAGSVLGGTDSNVQFSTLANGNIIQYDSALGYWKNVAPSSVAVTTFSGGTTGLTPATATAGAITLGGTLAVANGGTGVTTSTGTGSVVLATSPTLVTPALGTPTSGNFSTGTFTWPTFNQNTTGTASNITATSNSTLTTLSSLSLPGSQVTGNISGNAANVTGVVAIANGGTGQTTANAAFNALVPSQTGNSGKFLTTDGTNTSWATNPLGTVTSVAVSGGTTGLTTSGGPITTSGTITLAGTLATTNGGTGLTSFTANGVMYASSTSALTTGSALTFDGTTFAVGGAATGGSYKLQSYGASGNIGISIVNGGNAAGDFDGLEFVQGGTQRAVIYSNSNNLTTNVKGGANIFQLADVEQMRLTSTGLGIGTSSPGEKLVVANAGGSVAVQALASATGTSNLYFAKGTTGSDNYNGFIQYNHSTNAMNFGTNGGNTRATLDASGSLGIGTSSPGRKLDVAGSGRVIGGNGIFFEWNNGTDATYVSQEASAEFRINQSTASANSKITFLTQGTLRATLDSSGNLGLGVTPSAWLSGFKAMQLGAEAIMYSGTGGYSGFNAWGANFYVDSAGDARYLRSSYATSYQQNRNLGVHAWYIAPSGTAGSTISFTQAMTLDASGNLLVGTTTANGRFTASGSAGANTLYGTNGSIAAFFNGGDGTTASLMGTVGAYPLGFYTNGAERARIDSSGNLLIGATSASGNSNLRVSSSTTRSYVMVDTTATTGAEAGVRMKASRDWYTISDYDSGALRWFDATAGSERMRLDSSGNLLVGTTSTGNVNSNSFSVSTSSGYITVNHVNGTGSGTGYASFGYNAGEIGSITQNGTTGVLYNITSDYRLKNVVGAVTGAGERIDALKPIEYTWKSNGAATRGFLAHEFQEVYAGSVTGTKDAVDEDGNPVYQQMQASTTEVIADLVAELQSLRARVAQLESKGA